MCHTYCAKSSISPTITLEGSPPGKVVEEKEEEEMVKAERLRIHRQPQYRPRTGLARE
jgi:hypothetical protein